jgi:cytochrome c oxidase cbb3-type subunit 1
LAVGGVSWLAGINSGKLFLDWHGTARIAFPAAMTALWLVFVACAWIRRNEPGLGPRYRLAIVLTLATVPPAIYWASSRTVYPSVNPDSGGATGASLLGSTLGIVAIFGLLPVLLGLPPKVSTGSDRSVAGVADPGGFGGKSASPGFSVQRIVKLYWWAWIASMIEYAVIHHGHVSHHTVSQVLGLATLFLWVPLSWHYFGSFAWTPTARRWLAAAFVWWVCLIASGWATFLPGISERLKFTHALVGHAHLAMAGLVSSVHLALLDQWQPRLPIRNGFLTWQIATGAHVVSLLVLGSLEADRAGALWRSEQWTQLLLGVRGIAGGLMLFVAWRWWLATRRACPQVDLTQDQPTPAAPPRCP